MVNVSKYVCLGCGGEYLSFGEAEACRRKDDQNERAKTRMTKTDRRNAFIMGVSSKRAIDFAKRYLSVHSIVPEGANLNEDQFRFLMESAMKLAMAAYAQGLGDSLDTEDGKELGPLS